MQVALSNGAYFTFDNHNAFELNIGAIDIIGSPDGTLSIKADSAIEFIAPKITMKSDLTQATGHMGGKTGANGGFWAFNKFIEVTNGIITAIK